MIDVSSGLPLVSIITPSYNHAPYIRQTIDSVLSQDYPNVEHIVVDGGSTDGTVAILHEYGERYPDRFRWMSEPDKGQADALNKGIALARGEFIGWQNSDDYYLLNAFADPIQYLRDHPTVAAVYSGCLWVNEVGMAVGQFPAGEFDYQRLLEYCYIANQAAFVRRSALLACGGVTVDLHYAMDYDLWLRLGLEHRIDFIPGMRAAWRFLPTAKSNAGLLVHRRDCIRAVEGIASRAELSANHKARAEWSLQRHLFNALLVALSYGEDAYAEELLTKALTLDSGLSRWRYFCGEVLVRRMLVDSHFGFPDPERVADVPSRVLALLNSRGMGQTSFADQMISLVHVFDALYPRRSSGLHKSVAYLVRAVQADPSLLLYPAPKAALLRLYYGAHGTAVFHMISTVWAASARVRASTRAVARTFQKSTTAGSTANRSVGDSGRPWGS